MLLLHGTYWSRVWQPVLDEIAAAGLHPVAVNFRGLGFPGVNWRLLTHRPPVGRLALAFIDALGNEGPVMVAGHDIGGGVAQHLLIRRVVEVPRLALVNAGRYNSWPVPGVARFRDPAVAAASSTEDVLAARRQSVSEGALPAQRAKPKSRMLLRAVDRSPSCAVLAGASRGSR